MTRIKSGELRGLTKDELTQKMGDFKKELFGFQSQSIAGNLEKPHKIKILKKDIAKILTILKEMELKDAKRT